MRKILLGLLGLLYLADAILLFYSTTSGPFPSVVPLGTPTAYRNIYVHVPISISTYLAFTLGFLGALAYLTKGQDKFERLAHVSIISGIILGASTLVTGMIWARESWGAAWNWDPRETGILFMWLAFLVYLAIRSSVTDPDVRPKISMAFAVAAYSTIPLSFVIPYVMPSLHPTAPQTSMFLKSGLTKALFSARMAVVNLGVLALIVLAWRKKVEKVRYLAIPLLTASLAVLALQLPANLASSSPSSGEFKAVVMEGNYNGSFHLKVLAGGKVYELIYDGEPPVKPVKVEFQGKEFLTLEKHWVLVKGVVRDSLIEASSLKLINYWGVSINALIYALTVLSLLVMAEREGS